MKQKISIVTLGVADISVSKKFYEETLGFTPTKDSNESVVFYDMGCMQLGLYNDKALAEDATVSQEGSGFRRFAIAHNEPSIEAVDELFAELKEKGVTIVKEPEKVFWGEKAWDAFARPFEIFLESTNRNIQKVYSLCKRAQRLLR